MALEPAVATMWGVVLLARSPQAAQFWEWCWWSSPGIGAERSGRRRPGNAYSLRMASGTPTQAMPIAHIVVRTAVTSNETNVSSPAIDRRAVPDPFAAPVADVLEGLDSPPGGLDRAEAQRRAERWGPNRLPEPERESLFVRIFKHFDDVLIYILLAAAVLRRSSGSGLTSGHLRVAVISAMIGYIQEVVPRTRSRASEDAVAERTGQTRR